MIVLKVASTIAVLVCAVQAAPLSTRCQGVECNRDAHAGSVNTGSVTNVVPETNIVPITRLQPIVKVHTAIVDWDCTQDPSAQPTLFGVSHQPLKGLPLGNMMYRNPIGEIGDTNSDLFMNRMRRLSMYNRLPLTMNSMMKRRLKDDTSVTMRPNCVPSASDSCVQDIPVSTTDMGSVVTATPSNVILPSTVYQGKVVSGAADVYTAEVTDATLPSQRVNLASDTKIQPVTKVFPSTTYQPSVDQKATIVEATPPTDQSLGQSSVSLGSSVYIRPTTTVEPLTIFQPRIQSLPFIIHSETACGEDVFQQQQQIQQRHRMMSFDRPDKFASFRDM
ncbi:hypothetical protein FBU30_002159 [Linnemannia zychae]|nr:hypothetical protein FBU30_002159 [Linnemannia zychae]